VVRPGCPSHGEKTYATAGEANRMADSLDREPRGPLGFLAVLGGTLHREPRRRGRSETTAPRCTASRAGTTGLKARRHAAPRAAPARPVLKRGGTLHREPRRRGRS
jgi:hypothetical protein